MKASTLKRIMNIWPPYLGAGIKVRDISPDYRRVVVELRQKWYNRNYVGTHFGGSLYSMVDPFYMLMLINILGKDYLVWDRYACIDFVAPGRGTVTAEFTLNDGHIEKIKRETAVCEKYIAELPVEIIDEKGGIVAKATKHLYVRLKKRVCQPGE